VNIGIIVVSQTGNTQSVAMQLKEKLAAAGHAVSMELLKPVGEVKPGMKDIRFEALPDLGAYDALVFGAPVQAFALHPAMASYLAQVGPLQNKKVALLVTEAFRYAWLGGNRAIGQMSKACEAQGAQVCGSGVVNWQNPRRAQQIVEVTDRLSRLF
jgi:flavodoxin